MKNVPKLRFKGFSDEWSKNKLSKYVINFIVPMRDKPKVFDGEIPWCRIEDIEGKYLNTTLSNQYVSTDTINEMNLKVYPKGTVLCSCSATLGICAITTRELITNQTFIGLVSGNKLLNEFLYYRMLTYSNKLNKLSTGTTIAYLSRQEFEDLLVKIPSIEEQEKIANFLSKVDKLIEKQDEKVNNLEQYKKGMMQKLFSQEIRFKKDDGEEYPEWVKRKLGEVCDIVGGGTPSTTEEEFWNGNIQWFTPTEIKESKYVRNSNRTITEVGVKKSSAKVLPKGTILLTTRATLGEMAILTCEATTNQGFQSLIAKENVSNEFIYYMKDKIKRYCYTHASGSTFLEISKSSLEKFRFYLPCYDEQVKIANFLSKVDLIVEKEKEKLEELREWKKGLLQQMFV